MGPEMMQGIQIAVIAHYLNGERETDWVGLLSRLFHRLGKAFKIAPPVQPGVRRRLRRS